MMSSLDMNFLDPQVAQGNYCARSSWNWSANIWNGIERGYLILGG